MTQVKMAEKRRVRGMWPLIGFLLVVAIAAIAYFASEPALAFARQNLRGFVVRGEDVQIARFGVAAVIFVVLIASVGLIVALFSPKKAIQVKESDLAKEREQMQFERRYERMKQRDMAMKLRQRLREENKNKDEFTY
jgi:cytochrome c-type biogenesis protein CcmH/NrfG